MRILSPWTEDSRTKDPQTKNQGPRFLNHRTEDPRIKDPRIEDPVHGLEFCRDVAWFEEFLNDCLSFDFCVHSKMLRKS